MPMDTDLRPSLGRTLSRRAFVAGAGALLAACSRTGYVPEAAYAVDPMLYAALPDERFQVPAVKSTDIKPQFARELVAYDGPEPAGTIIVDPATKYLHFVLEGGQAMRYGIGVGREGFGWSGRADIARKAAWPRWTPPAEMIARQPELEQYRHGMDPGLGNPLGARALYLYQDGRDTLYRIHGTNEPRSIGSNVSSGCIRLINQDVIDLYARVPVGTRVVVLEAAAPVA